MSSPFPNATYHPFPADFCSDPLWDLSTIWYTSSPRLSECFLQTALIWIPCGFLWLMLPLEIYGLLSSKYNIRRWTWVSFTKIVFLMLLLIVSLTEMGFEIDRSIRHLTTGVNVYAPVVKSATMILASAFIYYDRRKGRTASGIMFCFWLMMIATNMIVFYTLISDAIYLGIQLDSVFVLRLAWFPLILIEFILSCFGEYFPDLRVGDVKPNPAEYASFLNQIFYWWFNYMGYLGWKRPLTQDDMYDILPDYQAHVMVEPLEKNWKTEMLRVKRSKESNSKKPYKPSLLKALIKTYWKTLSFTCILRLATDAFGFATPQLLQLIIGFVKSKDKEQEEGWKGYFYAFLMFFAMLLQSVIINWYMYKTWGGCGMRVKGALIALIYRKTLRITSAVKQSSSVGEIVNHMSIDAQRFMDFMGFIHTLWSAPLQIAVAFYFLYDLLGVSMFAGLITLILTLPINAFAFTHVKVLQNAQMKEKDGRIKLMTEILNGVKVLKLYAWEEAFQKEILTIRDRELQVLKKSAYYGALSYTLFVLSPFLVAFSIFVTYVLIRPENVLTAEIFFPAMTLINILRVPMTMLSPAVMTAIQVRISEVRLTKFFQNEELDPSNVEELPPSSSNAVLISNGTFSWTKERESACLTNINVTVKTGEFVAVVGRVGTGKSSLCAAMLGLMEKNSGQVALKGRVAYVPQQAWIQNLTVQENILFGSKLDNNYYQNIITSCALDTDLDALSGGDQTEIGERGANLSGGQKQRISLARAAYMNADVYIFDDPLSAVDAHVGKHIFEHVIGPNGILRNKTRILVTHGIGFLPQTDKIVVLSNGTVSETGTYRQLLHNNGAFAEFLRTYLAEEQESEFSTDPIDATVKQKILGEIGDAPTELHSRRGSHVSLNRVRSILKRASRISGSSKRLDEPEKIELLAQDANTGKLVEEEKAQTGVVKWEVYFMFAKQMTYKITATLLILYGIYSGLGTGVNFWLADWLSDATTAGQNGTDWRDYRLGVYGAFTVLQGIFIAGFSICMAQGRVKASRNLHERLLTKILRCPMWFFDTTPLGRIINRFSRDVDTVDVLIPGNIEFWLFNLFGVFSTMIVICISTPALAVVLIPLGVFYFFMQRFFISTSRQLKRIESISRSPIFSHFQESITGAGVIIATKQTDRFIRANELLVDKNNTSLFLIIAANRWITVRLEILGIFITFFASLFAVIGRDQNWGISSETIGLSITYALQINTLLNWLLWVTSELESNIVSVERIKEYTEVPQEAPWSLPNVKLPDNWPAAGQITFHDYQTRYREGLDLVLKGLTSKIQSGEKIGIVGRTGAGKSSLTLSLFRIIEATGGKIDIDGIDISQLGLHDVRSRITILPQEPVLFTGTLRMNLDPFRQHLDNEIWDALEHSHLRQFVSALPEGLHQLVADGGENYSVGQRQLICLARALLRKTKILVLDEATAAIDLHTDDLIQQTIRDKFADCTILTIAHRINTIMDSTRIMVLDQGKIKEFASPAQLLQDKTSIFYSLAKTANLVD